MVYADNAATTEMSQDAISAMLPYFAQSYGNPSSLYAFGQRFKEALEDARTRIAACLGADPRETVFTSDGGEADNDLRHVKTQDKPKKDEMSLDGQG